jgi:hypothetical protein
MSRSGPENQCVELAIDHGKIGIRDSKNPVGGTLSVDRHAFAALLTTVKDGQFDVS